MLEDHSYLSPLYAKNQNLLELGLAVVHGSGQERSHEQAVAELVERGLAGVSKSRLPVRFAVLIATGDWCEAEVPLPARVRRELAERLDYQVPLIGGSTGLIYCSTEAAERQFIKQGVLLLLFRSEEMCVTVVARDQPHAAKPEERARKISQLADELDRQAGNKLGMGANRFLFGFLPGVFTDAHGKQVYCDHELHQDLLTAFNNRYLFFGASTTSDFSQTGGYQFADDRCLRSGLALALMETDLCLGAAMAHGFERDNKARVEVEELADPDSDGAGYEVTRLDGKPAIQRLQELSSEGLVELDRPVFGLPYGTDSKIFWPMAPVSATQPILRLKRKVMPGDNLYVLKATPVQLLEAATSAVDRAVDQSTVKYTELSLLLCFSCGGRIKQYQDQQPNWQEMVESVRRKYPDLPIIGVMSAGEFGIDKAHQARSENMSLSVICPANAYTRRAQSRSLEKNLIRAASRLLHCRSPKEVMRGALLGAVEAGATGGKVNLVDHELERILGEGLGYALPARSTDKPDWEKVAPHTNYPLPKQQGGDFPLMLRNDAIEAVPDLPFPINFTNTPSDTLNKKSPGKWDDVVALVVRTLRAVFIEDSGKLVGSGLINEIARAAGKVKSQLVVPLVGSRLKVLATLQLSFPDDKPLDRESMVLWVGFAQTVAAALERAAEAEQREMQEQLNKLGDEIMRAPLGTLFNPHTWCEQYLSEVVKMLGADGSIMRTLRLSNRDDAHDEYKLRAATGFLADIIKEARPSLSVSDNSFRLPVLEAGGVFCCTREKVADLYSEVKALREPKRYSEPLAERVKQINSTALLPLRESSKVLGSMEVYSKQEYFFTERRHQITLIAATLAGNILQAKRAEYFRANLFEGIKELADLNGDLMKNLSETTEETAKERLKVILESVCRSTGADVGSIFRWYEEPRKLLLHTSRGWYQPQDGLAEYSEGELWTGKLISATSQITISLPDQESMAPPNRKYYEEMIRPEHRYDKNNARVGVRLTDGAKLVGILTLNYYKTNSETLRERGDMILPFLQGAAQVVTLGLEASLRQDLEERTKKFFETKKQVFNLLINREQREALALMRKSYQVERVTFYQWRDEKLKLGGNAQTDESLEQHLLQEQFEPIGVLRDLLKEKEKYVLILSADDQRLRGWPNRQGITDLLVVPMIALDGELMGILEFVNRKKDAAQPYVCYDELEIEEALDLARPLAGTLQIEEKQQELGNLSHQLALANKMGARGLFSQIVMHQLLEPFAHMRQVLDWLRLNPESSAEERKHRLNRIETFYNQAVETLQRAGRRKTPGVVQPEKLYTLLREALRFVDPAIPPSLKVTRPSDLRVEVNIDLWTMVGALINLLTNALDASKGHGVLSISNQLSADERTVNIHIFNTCEPPPTEADIQRYLLPGHTEKGGKGHLGLGLPLAKQAIENAGGTLGLHPTVNGVEAIITLPVVAKR